MFYKVKVLKAHSFAGSRREVGDEYSARQNQAKILEALGKVEILAGTETRSPSFAPVVKTAKAKAPVQQESAESEAETAGNSEEVVSGEAVDESKSEADTENVSENNEEEKTDSVEETPAKPKRRGSKYETKVMTSK